MLLIQIPNNNSLVDFILSEISKLPFDEQEVVRISLAAEYWQNIYMNSFSNLQRRKT